MNQQFTPDDWDKLWLATNKIIQQAQKEFDARLEEYVLRNLKELGYEFQDREEFYTFCKKRLCVKKYYRGHRVCDILLDCDDDGKGILVGVFSDKIKMENRDGNTTITIGWD